MICDEAAIPKLQELFGMAVSVEDKYSSSDFQSLGRTHGYGLWNGVRFRMAHSDVNNIEPVEVKNSVCLDDFELLFAQLGVEMSPEDVVDWLESDSNDEGVQIYTDTEICDLVSRDTCQEADSDIDDDTPNTDEDLSPVSSHSDAARMFELCLTWLEHQPKATVYNTSMLRELCALAAKKRWDSLKQSHIQDYFKQ